MPERMPISVKAIFIMGLMESIRNNSSTTVSVSIVVLLLAVYLIFRQLGGGGSGLNNPKWMYDLSTGQLVAASADVVAPFDNGSGSYDFGRLGTAGSQVDAVIYSCGNPGKIDAGMNIEDLESLGARIAYLSRFARLPASDSEEAMLSEPPIFVATPEGKEWVPQFSPKGMEIQDSGFFMCDESTPPKRAIPS